MILQAKVTEVRELLAQGNLSQRQIARMTGVSRGTIASIVSGRRPDYPVKQPDEEEVHYELPPVRCRGCGGMVYVPCRLCRVRALRAQQLRLDRARRRGEQPAMLAAAG